MMNARTFQLFGGITDHIETEQKVVALTFDDGPTKQVEDILALLEKYNVKATFFLIGNEIEKNREEAERIVVEGHQIGNHTYSHKRMVLKSPSYIRREIEKTDALIRESGYIGKIDFRPPYGKKLFTLPYYLNKHDRETITWDLEPDVADDKLAYVQQNVENGSIILFHPMYSNDSEYLQAMEEVIQFLLEEGYTFVSINELQTYKR